MLAAPATISDNDRRVLPCRLRQLLCLGGSESAFRAAVAPLTELPGASLSTGSRSYLDVQRIWAGCATESAQACRELRPSAFAAKSGDDFYWYGNVPKDRNLPEDFKRQCLHGYLAAISYVDAQVGRLLDTLEATDVVPRVCCRRGVGRHLTSGIVTSGRVSLVGAGPGDPGLLTLHGRRCLEGADVVIYDNLSNPDLLAFTRSDCEIVFTGKHGSGVRLFWN